MRIGGSLTVSTDDPMGIAQAHKEAGYRAAYCPEVSIHDKDRIRDISSAFGQTDIVISEVAAWCNMYDPDPAVRESNLRYVSERLALAEELGALSCINISCSFAPNTPETFNPYHPHADNLTDRGFDFTVETVRKVIDAVKPKRTKFCLEFMQWLIPDSPECYHRLIQAVDREAFAVHVDPVNIIVSPRQYFNNAQLIKECFRLLGPWIIGCHAKDIILRNDLALHFDEVVPGRGYLDYRVYLQEIAKLQKDIPLMIEHLSSEAEYKEAKDFIVSVGTSEGLSFER